MVDQLPVHYRSVFNLYVIDGFKHKEISKLLGIPVGTSKSYLARSRKKLYDMLLQQAKEKKKSPRVAAFALFSGHSVDHIFKEGFKEGDQAFGKSLVSPPEVLKTKEVRLVTGADVSKAFGLLPVVTAIGSFLLGATTML